MAYTKIDRFLHDIGAELLRYGTIIDDNRTTDEEGNEHRYLTIKYNGLRYAIHKVNGLTITAQSWDVKF